MDALFRAYDSGRADGVRGVRDSAAAEHPETGPDYRMGFLDARVEIFRMLAEARKFLDEDVI